MTKKRKPINVSGSFPTTDIILSIFDFEENDNLLLDLVLEHKRNSSCEGKWIFGLVDFFKKEQFNTFSKPCLYSVKLELELVKNVPTILKEKYGFLEDTTFKSDEIALYGVFMVYCDPD